MPGSLIKNWNDCWLEGPVTMCLTSASMSLCLANMVRTESTEYSVCVRRAVIAALDHWRVF